MAHVILINPFEVGEGREEEFVRGWRKAAEYLRHMPGFVSTHLHKSLDPTAKYQFVNIAEWTSPQHFEAAMRSEGFTQLRDNNLPFVAHPALYRVIDDLL